MENDNRIQIIQVKYGKYEYTMGCDFSQQSDPVYSVKYRINGKSRWLHNIYQLGIPNYLMTDDDFHENLLDNDYLIKNSDNIDSLYVNEFQGLQLDEYESMVDDINEHQDNPAVPFVRYLLRLYSADGEGVYKLIEEGVGRYADEIPLPPFDYEKEMDLVTGF